MKRTKSKKKQKSKEYYWQNREEINAKRRKKYKELQAIQEKHWMIKDIEENMERILTKEAALE